MHMSYLTFHLVFILPPLVLLGIMVWRQPNRRMARWSIPTLALIALTYATPWDNWLVAAGIWTYGVERVLFTVGYVPIEEYLFFVLQPLLTGFWFYAVMRWQPPGWGAARPRLRRWGTAAFLVAAALSAALLSAPVRYSYLAMILVWVCPVLALHWGVGGGQIWRNWRLNALAIVPPTLYLAVVDRYAIGGGIWHITERTSTGWMTFGLPVEELLFFLLTNVMVVQGLLLFEWVVDTARHRAWAGALGAVWRRVLPSLPLAPTGTARQTLLNTVIMPSWALIGGLALLFLLPIHVPLWVQLVPLVLSAALFGLPHGAIDHLVPGFVTRKPLPPRKMALLVAAYLLPIGAVLALWFVAPVAGFVFFILLTWFHWGLGDLHAVLAYEGAHFLESRLQRGLAALVRGALPMLVPLAFFPADYSAAAEAIVGSFGAADADALLWAFTGEFRAGVLTLLVGGIVATLLTALPAAMHGGLMREWTTYAGEIGLLLFYFAVVPPFLAVGVYFCFWHATRHIGRLVLLDEDAAASLQRGDWRRALARFARLAAPLTVVSLVMLGALYWVVPARPGDALAWVGLYLALIAALTVPHTLIVLWLDAVQGVWRPAAVPRRQTPPPMSASVVRSR